MARSVHLVEGAGVERVVAQELVEGAVKLVRPRPGHDVDLPAAGPARLRRIAAGLHLELLHRVRRGASWPVTSTTVLSDERVRSMSSVIGWPTSSLMVRVCGEKPWACTPSVY